MKVLVVPMSKCCCPPFPKKPHKKLMWELHFYQRKLPMTKSIFNILSFGVSFRPAIIMQLKCNTMYLIQTLNATWISNVDQSGKKLRWCREGNSFVNAQMGNA